jgi:uroporphyrin-3 C-methyltransferase
MNNELKSDRQNVEAPDPQIPPPLPKPSRWPAVLAVIAVLAVLVMVGVGHFYWQSMQLRFAQLRQVIDQASAQQHTLGAQMQQRGRVFAEQQERLQTQDELIRQQADTIAEQREKLARQEQAVAQTLQNIRQTLGHSGQAWRAAEAAYLIELASLRLSLEQDAGTALSALNSADRRLQETGEARWLPIRERLARDIAALQSVDTADRAALSQQLVDLAAGVDGLALRVQNVAPNQAASSEPPSERRSSEERSLDSLWRDSLEGLKSLVRIRRNDGMGGALIPGEDQHYQVRQNLRLQLDAARFGLLRADAELYRSSLETAKVWLQTFFKQDSSATERYLEALARLMEADVHPEFPDLSPTLQALRQLLQQEAESA